MKKITAIILLIVFLLLPTNPGNGQSFPKSNLNNYVEQGLQNNIVLQQKKISYQKSPLFTQNCSRLFPPFNRGHADYTSGEGGRNISIPVGDMLNPVYSLSINLQVKYVSTNR